jgi:hypothetical protein
MPCSLMSLKSHLLRRHLFCNLRSRMPRPPKSLGVHKTLHLVSLYFFLSPPPSQKKRDLNIVEGHLITDMDHRQCPVPYGLDTEYTGAGSSSVPDQDALIE